MKCTNNKNSFKFLKKKILCLFMMLVIMNLTGCGQAAYDMPYDSNYQVSSFKLVQTDNTQTVKPFASDLCVVDKDISSSAVSLSDVGAAALFDLNSGKTLYAKNANKQLPPASITKVMTALVAMKHAPMDQVLTASDNVLITEPGAQLCGLKPGDSMTLDQALHIMLIHSANDVAVMIAEGVGDTVDGFVGMMNEEARALGATNCNFVNPNGLTADGHYVTAYDLYLIFSEALKYDVFNEIIHMTTYNTTFTAKDGSDKTLDLKTLNLYLRGDYTAPDNITVIGGKTGTTNAAGHCLILLSRDKSSNPYISVILNSASTEDLYLKMTDLLKAVE